MSLDLSSLNNAINQLRSSLDYAASPMAREDAKLFQQFRNSAIQCFEFSFELSIKLLRRQLEQFESAAVIDRLPYRDLIRVGFERGLIDEPVVWFHFRDQRNATAHTYDESKAAAVFLALPAFLHSAEQLYQQLRALNA